MDDVVTGGTTLLSRYFQPEELDKIKGEPHEYPDLRTRAIAFSITMDWNARRRDSVIEGYSGYLTELCKGDASKLLHDVLTAVVEQPEDEEADEDKSIVTDLYDELSETDKEEFIDFADFQYRIFDAALPAIHKQFPSTDKTFQRMTLASLIEDEYADLEAAYDDENLRRTPVEELEDRAKAGDKRAEFDLCVKYSRGLGVTPDPELELFWMRKAAENSYLYRQSMLGETLLEMEGHDPEHLREGIELLNDALGKGDTYAAAVLGDIYGDEDHPLYGPKKSEEMYAKQEEMQRKEDERSDEESTRIQEQTLRKEK